LSLAYLVSGDCQQAISQITKQDFYLEKISLYRDGVEIPEEIIEYVAATSNRMLENLKEL
jgi:hypothetical protein